MAARVVTMKRDVIRKAAGPLSIPAIARGLAVTSRHFFRNLFGWIRGEPTIATIMFPEQRMPAPSSLRGMPVLVQMDDGNERCVACGLCEWACPVECITIYPAETEDAIERYPKVFDIDMSRCMYCGFCEEACPEEAIVMSHRVEISSFSREGTVWHKQDLLVPVAELRPRLEFIRRGYER